MSHRGLAPGDATLFGAEARPSLRQAASDLCWLLSRGYAEVAALKLVGDRYDLTARQRSAVGRAVCTDDALSRRLARLVSPPHIQEKIVLLDGFNILTTLEVALSGGVVMLCRDGCCRDIAGVHGTYRRVEETLPALALLAETLTALKPVACVWYLDSPVSNSGRLKGIILEAAAEKKWPFTVELVADPDPILAQSEEIIVTADSAILDRCKQWLNLNRSIILEKAPNALLVPLG